MTLSKRVKRLEYQNGGANAEYYTLITATRDTEDGPVPFSMSPGEFGSPLGVIKWPNGKYETIEIREGESLKVFEKRVEDAARVQQ